MFYVLVFGILAVVLIVGFFAARSRRQQGWEDWDEEQEHTHSQAAHSDAARRSRKAKRSQSQHDRRKRH
jgi:hypothetical protein